MDFTSFTTTSLNSLATHIVTGDAHWTIGKALPGGSSHLTPQQLPKAQKSNSSPLCLALKQSTSQSLL